VIAKADELFKRVDVLVNAGGMTDRGSILDTTPERFDSIFATNVRGPFFLMQETIKIMRRKTLPVASSISAPCHHWPASRLLPPIAHQRRTRDVNPQHRLRVVTQPDPRKRAEYRLDGLGR
jgi:NAD(P)-dependent dehydrogenase (short-subunit alcohol dehydrogenase family)